MSQSINPSQNKISTQSVTTGQDVYPYPLNDRDKINDLYKNKYLKILTAMFNPIPSSNIIKSSDKRNWPVEGNGNIIKMDQFVKPLDRSYEENEFPKHLLECQPIGGFKTNIQNLTSGEGNPQNIFKRLATIANKNLVAVSEAGMYNITPYNSALIDILKAEFAKSKKDITDCIKFYEATPNITFNDTAFISGLFDINHTKSDYVTMPGVKIINANGITILNCHLDSKGPNLYIKSPNVWSKNVTNFLVNQLPPYNLNSNIDVIVGDTNITVSKSNKGNDVFDRKKLLETIIEGITERYPPDISEPKGIEKSWVLISSSVKINKIRSGFLLLNNQMYKANNPETIEEDGTIIAIRSYTNRLKLLLTPEYCNINFGKKSHICYKNKYSSGFTHIIQPMEANPINFLQFNKIDDCMHNTTFMPNDSVFIDHSVVAVSKKALIELTSKYNIKYHDLTKYQWNNLVALNLGSIINSKNPWNLKLFQDDALTKIHTVDEWLFSKFINKLNIPQNPQISNYESYNGPLFGKLEFKKDTIPYFADVMTRVHMYLESEIPTLFKPFPNPLSLHSPNVTPVPSIPTVPNVSNTLPVLPSETHPYNGNGGYHKTRKIKKYKTKKMKRKIKNKTTITRKMNKRKTYKY